MNFTTARHSDPYYHEPHRCDCGAPVATEGAECDTCYYGLVVEVPVCECGAVVAVEGDECDGCAEIEAREIQEAA